MNTDGNVNERGGRSIVIDPVASAFHLKVWICMIESCEGLLSFVVAYVNLLVCVSRNIVLLVVLGW